MSGLFLSRGQRKVVASMSEQIFPQIYIGYGWDDLSSIEIDMFIFLLGLNGKVLHHENTLGEKNVLFYNSQNRMLTSNLKQNQYEVESYDSIKYSSFGDYFENTIPASPNFEVIGPIQNHQLAAADLIKYENYDDESLLLNLNKINPNVHVVKFIFSIYQAEERSQNFGQIENAYIRLINNSTNDVIMRYNLVEDYSCETAVEIGNIFKNNSDWVFEAAGSGTSYGVSYYLNEFM